MSKGRCLIPTKEDVEKEHISFPKKVFLVKTTDNLAGFVNRLSFTEKITELSPSELSIIKQCLYGELDDLKELGSPHFKEREQIIKSLLKKLESL